MAHQDPTAQARERERLDLAHQELCTALTAARNWIELARSSRSRADAEESAHLLDFHLGAAGEAVDRLHDLARLMKAWRRSG